LMGFAALNPSYAGTPGHVATPVQHTARITAS
jgi:hypothetical protein